LFAGLPSGYVDQSLESALAAAKGNGRNVWIYFSYRKDTCSGCSYIDANITSGNEVGQAYKKFNFVHAEPWPPSEKSRSLKKLYGVPQWAPHFVFVDPKGREICRAISGFNNTRVDALPIAKAGALTFEEATARAERFGAGSSRNCLDLMKE